MKNMDRVFRWIELKEKNYLYPHPVVKDQKYLIQTDFPQCIQGAIEKSYLPHPDQDKSYLLKEGIHTDGKTPIYKIDIDLLNFSLLQGSHDRIKKINEILSRKIQAVFRSEEHAAKDLLKRFESQKKCHVCQKHGILNPELEKFINLLIS